MISHAWLPTVVFVLLGVSDAAADSPVHFDLSLRLDPPAHRLEVRATVRGSFEGAARFVLHSGLDPECSTAGTTMTAVEESAARRSVLDGSVSVPVTEYEVRFEDPAATEFTLRYGGEIHHPIESGGEEYARSFSGSPGLIDERGIVLSTSAAWFPVIGDELMTFELRILSPEPWRTVSEGRLGESTVIGDLHLDHWVCEDPMDDIHIIGAPFHVTSRAVGGVDAMAFLRHPDPNLAAKYLEATAQYLDLYQRLIGPYPYPKFALVENFWETGYGMPSFTLLGPKIIRFPFILHSSYPHEILHNWWGNSVFVDWESGNWCEGLTAYLADHLVKEGQGRGAEYRRDSLDRFGSYVREGRDFPLEEFRSRHSSATEAVGYGKCLMLFHMLREELGDDGFLRGLQRFNRAFRFRRASFTDIADVFSRSAERDLHPFFEQWVRRVGAPELALEVRDGAIVLRQTQEDDPFTVTVPVALTFEDRSEVEIIAVPMTGREAIHSLGGVEPTRVDVDPRYDVFRRLDRTETPPTFGRLFGESDVAIVLPSEDGDVAAATWQSFAHLWTEGGNIAVHTDAEPELPGAAAVWILGRDNRHAPKVRALLERYGAKLDDVRLDFGAASVASADHCFAVAVESEDGATFGWIGASRDDSAAGLARKLPHYGKYSFLAFSGGEPTNDAKGQWPPLGSPLVWSRESGTARADLPPEEPLGRLAPVFDPQA
ncbi:MAG: peptidase M28, partial [Planctomycetes bacterium]|nr:peptidase M28 [Planctomycetota bacterium]